MTRLWNLRLNLDELNAVNLTGLTEANRADLWTGFVYGCNGLEIPEGSSRHLQAAFEMGSGFRQEAESHRERMSLGGRSSAESRKAKTGTAQPSKVVRGTLEPGSEGGSEAPSEGGLNQSTIYNLQSTGKPIAPQRRKKPEPPEPPEHLLSKLTTIAKDWPRRSDYNGSKADVSVLVRPSHIWARIQRFVPEADWELALNCGLVYLDELDKRERGVGNLIPNVCAMTNFWGEAGLWKKMVVKVDELS